ncbi:hypothetical protein TEA_008673 [Camellia sinensis var. sinensis]|uniref:Uncharacterized protein n=1 Tax=Camellia sinensis var. sinensis TaxID=542762 RepID=A0A4S4E321_CAMSN|nr:hypothetical protein TEA_008673 [Camellia sinensis var. sinensis]
MYEDTSSGSATQAEKEEVDSRSIYVGVFAAALAFSARTSTSALAAVNLTTALAFSVLFSQYMHSQDSIACCQPSTSDSGGTDNIVNGSAEAKCLYNLAVGLFISKRDNVSAITPLGSGSPSSIEGLSSALMMVMMYPLACCFIGPKLKA